MVQSRVIDAASLVREDTTIISVRLDYFECMIQQDAEGNLWEIMKTCGVSESEGSKQN